MIMFSSILCLLERGTYSLVWFKIRLKLMLMWLLFEMVGRLVAGHDLRAIPAGFQLEFLPTFK
jgi:hypothetical protein